MYADDQNSNNRICLNNFFVSTRVYYIIIVDTYSMDAKII